MLTKKELEDILKAWPDDEVVPEIQNFLNHGLNESEDMMRGLFKMLWV